MDISSIYHSHEWRNSVHFRTVPWQEDFSAHLRLVNHEPNIGCQSHLCCGNRCQSCDLSQPCSSCAEESVDTDSYAVFGCFWQVLEVVRSNYDTLTLKLQDGLDQYERYSEQHKEATFFKELVSAFPLSKPQPSSRAFALGSCIWGVAEQSIGLPPKPG